MALITFRDANGAGWRVWNVSREMLETRTADYLGPEFQAGWLVFQREGADERRRLAQFPDDWASLTPPQLEHLCARAQPVVAAPRGRGSDMHRSVSDVVRDP